MCRICNTRHASRLAPDATHGQLVVCEACGQKFGPYPGMVGVGFRSRSISHYHGEEQGDATKKVTFHLPVNFELCLTCYRKDQIANGEQPLFDPPYSELELNRVNELGIEVVTNPDHSIPLATLREQPSTLLPKEEIPATKPSPEALERLLSFEVIA